MSGKPTREATLELIKEYLPSEQMRKHSLAVEAVMRHFARKCGEDEEMWGVIGLAHDIDYERYPEQHCSRAPEILREAGWPEDYIRAVVSHGWGICSNVEPVTRLEKTLYTIDELTGLVAAAALVRPSKSILDLPVKSVTKKEGQGIRRRRRPLGDREGRGDAGRRARGLDRRHHRRHAQ